MLGTGAQSINKFGMAFIFQPDPILIAGTATPQPALDCGILQTRTPKQDNGEEVIYDDRDGTMAPVTVAQNKFEPSYDLELTQTGATMLALYARSAAPAPWTQSAGTFTDIAHKAWPNSPVKLLDATGLIPQFMIASITNLKVGASVAVRGVDYDYTPGDLDRGYVYILPTSTLVTAANTSITITYLLAAVTTGGYTIDPLSGGCTIEGYGEIHIAACEGKKRGIDTGRFSLIMPEMAIPMDKISTIKATVRKVKNYGSNLPNGRIYLTRGW